MPLAAWRSRRRYTHELMQKACLLASVSYRTLAPTAADACQRGPAGAVISLLVIQQATASIPRSAAAGEQRRHITAKCSVQQARHWRATQRRDRTAVRHSVRQCP